MITISLVTIGRRTESLTISEMESLVEFLTRRGTIVTKVVMSRVMQSSRCHTRSVMSRSCPRKGLSPTLPELPGETY